MFSKVTASMGSIVAQFQKMTIYQSHRVLVQRLSTRLPTKSGDNHVRIASHCMAMIHSRVQMGAPAK